MKLQSQTTSNVTPENLLLYSYGPLYPQFNVAEQQKIQSLAESVVHISRLNERREEGFQKRYIRFSHDCGFKKYKHLFTRFQGCRFHFTHFNNFKFAYFETEVSFGLIWMNLQNGRFHLQISILGTRARFKYRLYFCSFCV